MVAHPFVAPAWAELPLSLVVSLLALRGLRLKSNQRGEFVVVGVRHG